MEIKIVEIRDASTRIDAIAIRMIAANPIESHYIHDHAGYDPDGSSVILVRLDDGRGQNDPYQWPGGTMRHAHLYIQRFYPQISDGDVVDVEFNNGDSLQPKTAERLSRGR